MTVSVKLGFVPSYRRWNDWAEQVRRDSLLALTQLPGVQVVAPQVAPADAAPDPATGATAYGAVHTLDEAEIMADRFARELRQREEAIAADLLRPVVPASV